MLLEPCRQKDHAQIEEEHQEKGQVAVPAVEGELLHKGNRDHDDPLLFSRQLTAGNLHWIEDRAPSFPLRCHAKTRYRQPDQACLVDAAGEDTVQVRFTDAQWAVTPGQYVVFYDNEVCLGGGVIETSGNPVTGHKITPEPSPL